MKKKRCLTLSGIAFYLPSGVTSLSLSHSSQRSWQLIRFLALNCLLASSCLILAITIFCWDSCYHWSSSFSQPHPDRPARRFPGMTMFCLPSPWAYRSILPGMLSILLRWHGSLQHRMKPSTWQFCFGWSCLKPFGERGGLPFSALCW